jgi:PhoH-like ATPase
MAQNKKLFVLDTNVILHDSSCIYQFQEHDVVIPITVIEELDNFKKGNEILNYHAREFSRSLDAHSGDDLFETGHKIASGHGRIIVKLDQEFHEDLAFNFTRDKHDHKILNCAYRCAREFPRRTVILVSKDVNLRLKARAIGLLADDYTTDHVKDVSTLGSGSRVEEHMDKELIDSLYKEPYALQPECIGDRAAVNANEYLILRNGKRSALATYNPRAMQLERVDKMTACGIAPRNAEQTFALHALLNPDIKLVTISGKAGTGKTLLALAAALERRTLYRQIFMARPVVPLSNKDIGFLPGEISSKLAPYMQPLYDNLGVIQNQFSEKSSMHQRISDLLEKEKLKIAPLSYIRGRSIVRVYFIVDEAQNLTPHEVKTIITRAGEGTKIVLTGDVFQIDHPYLDSQSNGLSYCIEKMRDQPLYAHVNLEKGERSELAELASDLL